MCCMCIFAAVQGERRKKRAVSFKGKKHLNLCDEIMKKEQNWFMFAWIKMRNGIEDAADVAVELKEENGEGERELKAHFMRAYNMYTVWILNCGYELWKSNLHIKNSKVLWICRQAMIFRICILWVLICDVQHEQR